MRPCLKFKTQNDSNRDGRDFGDGMDGYETKNMHAPFPSEVLRLAALESNPDGTSGCEHPGHLATFMRTALCLLAGMSDVVSKGQS